MTNNKTYHAAVYLRLSREDGDVADGGKQVSNSIANQKELVMDYLKSHPEITVVSTYTDDGFSGVNFERPEFQRMLKDAESGAFSYVIAWKSNRMGRNMLQAMVNEARLNDLGVKCLYVEEDFADTAAGRFALRNMMNVNQFYSESMAEDVRRGMMDNAAKCMVNGRTPFGYRKGKDGKY